MIKRVAAFLVFFNCAVAFAQTIKTDVLVIGGSASGVAAAIQCARSKVKTVLVEQGSSLCPEMKGNSVITITVGHNLPSGIWGEFRNRIRDRYNKTPGFDTAYNAPLRLVPDIGAAILANIIDTVKNLTIALNTTFSGIKKDGDSWEVALNRGGKRETVKARVVVDATINGEVLNKANATIEVFDPRENTAGSNTYRTAIACGDGLPQQYTADITPDTYPPFPQYYIPVKAIMPKGADNIFATDKLLSAHINYLPVQLTLGQGVGVTAAYCAFFKTTTANLNVRMMQGELLDFKGYMLPLADITKDPHWRAIQQICATGLLKGVQKKINGEQQFDFVPDSIVTTAEIKPVMLETYTRAFIWFNREKPGVQFTIGNLMSFISELTLTDPDNLQKSISKAWTDQFHFTASFDPDRPITRREFAILANKYLNPFGRTVNLDGRVVN
jgi:hypothetical protein